MASSPTAVRSDDPARRRRLLDAALSVFLRFGYRKTSMDEVARAAGLSRQGLYLHFPTKEDLFRAVVEHALATALDAASVRLRDPSLPIEERLVGAFDEWIGRYVGVLRADVADLVEELAATYASLIEAREGDFVDAVTRAIRASGLPAAYRTAGLSARQLARILAATARGLKHTAASRPEFVDAFATAVRAICFPLRAG